MRDDEKYQRLCIPRRARVFRREIHGEGFILQGAGPGFQFFKHISFGGRVVPSDSGERIETASRNFIFTCYLWSRYDGGRTRRLLDHQIFFDFLWWSSSSERQRGTYRGHIAQFHFHLLLVVSIRDRRTPSLLDHRLLLGIQYLQNKLCRPFP